LQTTSSHNSLLCWTPYAIFFVLCRKSRPYGFRFRHVAKNVRSSFLQIIFHVSPDQNCFWKFSKYFGLKQLCLFYMMVLLVACIQRKKWSIRQLESWQIACTVWLYDVTKSTQWFC
jgi:hypothetical protein